MTEKEFDKKRFKPWEHVLFTSPNAPNIDGGRGVVLDCLVLAIDFEQRLFKLRDIENEHYDPMGDFWSRCEWVDRPPPRLRVSAKQKNND